MAWFFSCCCCSQVQLGELGSENHRLQEKLRNMNESHQRTIRSLEGRVTALTDDLEVTQSELHAIQAEYDGYKVRHICKQ